MKKFLTVLLVIAVMVTFSFGGSFASTAGTPTNSANVITKAKALDYAKAAYDSALSDLAKAAEDDFTSSEGFDKDGNYEVSEVVNESASATPNNVTYRVSVSKASYEKALDEDTVYKAAKDCIEEEYKRVINAINTAASDPDFKGFEKGVSTAYEDYPGFDTVTTTKTSVVTGIEETGTYYKYQFSIKVKTSENVIATTFANAAAVKAAKAAKADALDAVSAIKLDGVYSKDYNNTSESDYDVASKLVNKAVEALNAIADADASKANPIKQAKQEINKVDSVYTAAVGKAKEGGALYNGGKLTIVKTEDYDFGTGLNALTKISDAENVAADLTYAQNKTLSSMLTTLTAKKDDALAAYNALLRAERDADKPDQTKIADYEKAMTDVESAYKDAATAIEYLVKYTTKVSQLGSYDISSVFTTTWSIDDDTVDTLADFKGLGINTNKVCSVRSFDVDDTIKMASDVADAKDQAEKDKVYVNLDGSYVIQIEKALEDAIENIYVNGYNNYSWNKTTNTSELADRKVELVGVWENEVTVDGKVYPTVYEWNANAGDGGSYEEDQYDEIRAIVAETKAAINDATTVEAAEKAFTDGYAKFDAIPTAQAHKNSFTLKSGELTDAYDKAQANFHAYVQAKNTALSTLGTSSDYNWTPETLCSYYTQELAGEFYTSVYTADQLDAKYKEAVAVVDGLKTSKELKAQADEVVALINALPATITQADREAVVAAANAYDAYDDYVDMIGATNKFKTEGSYVKALDTLEEKYGDLVKADVKEIKDAYKALPALSKVTTADKDAIENIRKLADQFVENYGWTDMENSEITGLYSEALSGNYGPATPSATDASAKFCDYEEALVEAYVDVAEDLIAKLAVDPVDANAVAAARAAVDAIPDHLLDPYDAGLSTESYDKLVALEKVVKAENIKAVESLKITAGSTAKKGSITVKWSVKGDASAIDGYKVYRSTKANKGFKLYKTTTKTTYKNTKNLKKGTKYYYKVVAYKVIDGVTYTSDASNKAFRKAK